ncbi:uncharacterized protein LOC108891065 [Lates japonicus]|uniref:Uncharacterized protein n=1 Tax=Lates japonicus TaxID=270547 RepID=A0AAD3NB27_LATJO|nr:uncharacterized protein AKAME5_001939400 [Lates japonicus]
MMKLCRLCFLVLAISSISSGQEETTGSPAPAQENGDAPAPVTTSPALELPLEADNATLLTRVSPSTQRPTPENTTDVHGKDDMEEIIKAGKDDKNYSSNKTTEGGSSTKPPAPTLAGVPGSVTEDAGVRSTTDSAVKTTANKPATETGISSWGYVILAFIILVIIVLCIILYFLRRVSRTYSFDLQRQDPIINQFNEPTGTFEPVYLDDLDRPAPKDLVTTEDPSPPPAANGTSVQLEEKGSNGENAPQEQPDANGLETSPSSDTSPTLDDDTADKTSNPPGSIDLMFDGFREPPQNENNNNPSVCSSDPFVEINLNEPPWCDQLLSSPEATSSVLPFSPFSFSSSSSS